MDKFVVGIDFGTDSVRALLVNAYTGEEVGSAVQHYPRWKDNQYCDATISQFRQHPLDYIEGLTASVQEVLSGASSRVVANVVGISIDTTGSTPVPVNEQGIPLAMLPEFSENPNGMFVLWKDHTANAEAEEINFLAKRWPVDYTKYSGGMYSSEWFWSKILHLLRADDAVAQKAFSWVEHCDWMPAFLTGKTDPLSIKRSRCAAGHKAMWHEEFDGLPSEAFLSTLDKRMTGIRRRLYRSTYTSDEAVGKISPEWAARFRLPGHVMIGTGGIDAHFGAVGSNIKPYSLVKVIGTSTCDMLIAPNEKYSTQLVKGICGQVDGSIVPHMLGMEAGQAAFGDLYAWLAKVLSFPLKLLHFLPPKELASISENILPALAEHASKIPVREDDMVALDWINGRRTPDTDLTLTGTISGIRLGMEAPHIFKALVEATAFGSKAIINQFKNQNIPIHEVIALGGIAKKSPYVMQTLTNVLDLPIKVVRSEQTCALGAAMFAATAAGIYDTIEEAQTAMTSGFDKCYSPEKEKVPVLEHLFGRYCELGRNITVAASNNISFHIK